MVLNIFLFFSKGAIFIRLSAKRASRLPGGCCDAETKEPQPEPQTAHSSRIAGSARRGTIPQAKPRGANHTDANRNTGNASVGGSVGVWR
jgi:hypothetical protein